MGSKRLISFEDGSDVEEHIVGWKPKEYFSYIAISGLPLNAYHATISVQKSNKNTKVTWESYFASIIQRKNLMNSLNFYQIFMLNH